MIVDQLYTQPEPTVTSTRIFTEGRHKKLLKEDATYRKFHNLSRMLAERKMSDQEVLALFAAVEAGANAAGGNRTALGRGKDAVAGAYNSVKDAISKVLDSIQTSTPVKGVDAAYNDATDALGKALGGKDSKIMDSIKKYRLLAKEYPKTQLFVKTALIALAGMATGGAGLVAIAGITAAVDAAIKGEKLSSLIGKGAGAALMAYGAQEVQAMMAGSGDQIGLPSAETGGGANIPDTGGNIGGGVPDVTAPELATYTVQSGDTLSKIAQANNTSVTELQGLNPQLAAASGATGGQSLNPDVIFPGQQITLPPGTPGADVYAGGVGTAADTAAKVASGQYAPNPRSPLRLAETVKYKILPVSQLIDHKLTVMGWALNESIGKKPGNSVHLTRKGVFTVIENVDRYRVALLKEYRPSPVGPGREALPDLYRPDQPGAPAPVTAKPGMVGRGLNWLDKTAGKVGGYLSKQAQNFTRKVTAAKLKMEWQQLGHPSDSDQIAAFLATQGVPQPVITDVYSKMGIPFTAVAGSQAGGAGIQTGATSLIDPDTGQPYEKRKLAALHNQPAPAPAPAATQPAATTPAPTTATTPAPTTATTPEDPAATQAAANPFGQMTRTLNTYAPPETTSTGGTLKQTATGQVHRASATNPNGSGFRTTNPTAQAEPQAGQKIPLPAAGVGGQMELDFGPADPSSRKLAGKTPAWAKNNSLADPTAAWNKNNLTPVAETIKQVKKMLETVQTRDDVNFIKKYINHEFDRRGMVNQLATVQRNHLIERVTQIAAGRRRDYARQLAH